MHCVYVLPIRSRRGFTIIELVLTGIIIGAAGLVAASAIVTAQSSRRGAEQLQIAIHELQNQLEHANVLEWRELTVERLSRVPLSEFAVERIPGSRLTLSVVEVSEPRRAKKLEAQFHWPENEKFERPSLRLSTWIFAGKEAD